MRLAILSSVTLAAAQQPKVCMSYWEGSFMDENGPKYTIENLGLKTPSMPNGLKEGEGVYEGAEYACLACLTEMQNTKSCNVFADNRCFAVDVMTGFPKKSVEEITDKAAEATHQKEISDTDMQKWTFAMDVAGGGVPEGAKLCGPILYKAENPSATKQVVDAACSKGSPWCKERTKFEDCCLGFVPENALCADGKNCCGAKNTVTIGKSQNEVDAECAKSTGGS